MQLILFHVGSRSLRPLTTVTAAFCALVALYLWAAWPVVWPALSVGLDAGHGGKDPGAIGHGGLQEKVVTLNVAKMIAHMLEDAGEKAYLTRVDDSRLAASQRSDLRARVHAAHAADVDLLVSVHCNAYHLHYVRGPRTYYQPGSEQGRLLATTIQTELVAATGYGRKEPTAEDHLVTRESRMVAVIVELGYITNPGDEKLLADRAFQAKLATAVTAGILRYAQFANSVM